MKSHPSERRLFEEPAENHHVEFSSISQKKPVFLPRSGTRFTPRSPRRDSTVSRPADDERRPLWSTFFNGVCVSVSQGGTGNPSHVTPNTSLGFVQATPSRVLPSPTVNTREALGELGRRLSRFTSRLSSTFSQPTNISSGFCVLQT